MSESVVLPALGESVTEGTVTRWLKNVGDSVEVDEPLLEVSTDKVDTEIPSPVAGVVEEILVQEDETAEVGAVLAKVGDGSGSTDSAPADEPATAEAEPAAAQAEPAQQPAPAQQPEAQSAPEPQAQPAAQSGGDDAGSAGGDSQSVKLPSLGESITEGTVTRWLKSVGDSVEVDEPLLEVSTDKVDTEVPSPFAGVLQEILVQEDDTVEVGGELARIGSGAPASSGESAPAEPQQAEPEQEQAESTEAPQQEAAAPSEAPAQQEQQPAAPATSGAAGYEQPAPADEQAGAPAQPAAQAPAAEAPAASTAPSAESNAGYVTPIVRKLAHERGVDLSSLTGSGVGGRIRKEDVLAAAERASSAQPTASVPAAQSAPAPEVSELRGTSQKMSRLRKVIAERAVASLQSTAQLTTVVEVDVTRIAQLRQAKKDEFLEKTGSKLSFLPFFALAAAEALRTYPIINATVDGDSITYPSTENISIAVDTERGLLTPVLRDAGTKNLSEISGEIADLAARTRDNKLTPDELSGGTFTLTNTGSRGALFDTPLVFLPQVAILGTGAVVKKPVVISGPEGDSIAVRSTVYLALSYDHRIVDGADAARFLTQVRERLEGGQFEANLGI
ncbi:2-oxoglutarate dehydrogenase, E2 component, dihydrolipoamide succinyltransferase [Leucobacter chromiiresistens]|uniref:Dihydrolipoamide acetyltransferase component of pyruvate dehydrogenase complex n=1 Tax=Leucobacter chromiiresistens TaxID=1079994 RepID=A0A1H0ZXJ9_9MICO|nr:2-oxoglutarate dehydrogenase, E2 component, dihydrolipoamide succinyltransferase [Leucobacter chromiiresistens]SDQ31971.1 2-oxoglutarate dehydrogenase E2 component [Leucobacter chromiiresistens]